jgi:hypothetical protein
MLRGVSSWVPAGQNSPAVQGTAGNNTKDFSMLTMFMGIEHVSETWCCWHVKELMLCTERKRKKETGTIENTAKAG